MHDLDFKPARAADIESGRSDPRRSRDDLRGRVRRLRAHMLVHTQAPARLDQDLAELETELRQMATSSERRNDRG